MATTERSAFIPFILLLAFCAAALPEGFYNPSCTTDCPMTSALVSFLVGSLSLFALSYFALKFVNARLETPEGLLLVFLILFNPILGFTGTAGTAVPNDLAGTAIAVGILALTIRNDNAPEEDLQSGIILGGILLGLAPSYMPLVLLPLLIVFGRSQRKAVSALLFAGAVAAWLLPQIVRAGADLWLETAGANAAAWLSALDEAAHGFPGIETKRIIFLQKLFVEGMGGYAAVGSVAAALLLAGLAVGFARGAWRMFHRETDGLVIVVVTISLYIAWLIFNPNDIGQPRHVLPPAMLLLFPVWLGFTELMKEKGVARLAAILFLALYAIAGIGAAG